MKPPFRAHYSWKKQSTNSAVSPVIGIMLMLIVTVILAAIISGYVGGMSETKSKPPQLVLQTEAVKEKYVNVSMTIISAGEGIPTKDLKLITHWKNQTTGASGGNTTLAGNPYGYPLGIVPQKGENAKMGIHFGNYTLLGGTIMNVTSLEKDNPRADEIIFNTKSDETLQAGDAITITFVHIPSQATIFKQDLIIGGN